MIFSDTWKAYDGLIDYAAKAHYRVKHSKKTRANGKNHINRIENVSLFLIIIFDNSCKKEIL